MSKIQEDRRGRFVRVGDVTFRPGYVSRLSDDGERDMEDDAGWALGESVIAVPKAGEPIAKIRARGEERWWADQDQLPAVGKLWRYRAGQKYKQRNGKTVTIKEVFRPLKDNVYACETSSGNFHGVAGHYSPHDMEETSYDLVELVQR